MSLSNVHPADRPTLYRGSSGAWVRHAQRLARRHVPTLIADGFYGPETERTLDTLLGTPFVDREAWAALESLK